MNLDVGRLILGCRNMAKGEKARGDILASCQSSKIPGVEVWQIDMANYGSVLSFGYRVREMLPRLDAVILNAGVELLQFDLAEGIESTLTVNVVSTFLLARLVLPKLRQTAEEQRRDTHLTFVGSMIHIFGQSDQLLTAKRGEIFQNLSDPEKADMASRYPLSKLMLTLAHRDLVSRIDKSRKRNMSSVIINDVNPGWCNTDLFRHEQPGIGQRIAFWMMGKTAEVGARTLVHAASTRKETHGEYLSEGRVKPVSRFIRSKAGQDVQEKLGNELCELLESIKPGLTQEV